MCDPTAIAVTSLALSAGSRIAQHQAEEERQEAVAESARRNRRLETRDLGFRQTEERMAASRILRNIRLQAEETEGTIRSSAAEAGVEGGAVQALLGELRASQGRASQDVKDSRKSVVEQLQRQKEAAIARERSTRAGAPGPSTLATGLTIGGDVTNFLTDYYRITEAENRAEDILEDD